MSRRATCGATQARKRVEYAQEQLTLDEIGHPGPPPPPARPPAPAGCWPRSPPQTPSAACASEKRSRDADHRAAVGLLVTVHPEGPDLAKALRIALDAKDPMHYPNDYLTPDRHTAVLQTPDRVVDCL